MDNASPFVYISKRKVNIVKKHKKKEWDKKVEHFDSGDEMQAEEMNVFGAENEEEALQNMNPLQRGPKHVQEIDSNVCAIKLYEVGGGLDDLATGDSYTCQNCNVYLNKYSKLEAQGDLQSHYIWECEFCHYGNKLIIEEEEKPKNDMQTYILERAEETKEEVGEAPESPESPDTAPITVIFCIDVSGSMDDTQPMKEHFKYMTSKGRATRLELVKLAIDRQLEEMVKEHPHWKVGFVLFEDRVHVYGDCTQKHTILSDTGLLNDYGRLLESSMGLFKSQLSLPVKESKSHLLDGLREIQTMGCTALGPGLLCSTALAGKGGPGSKVIICTDGLANTGLGSLGWGNSAGVSPETLEFYTHVGEYAQGKGVSISIISLVASECRLDMLSPIANLTGGSIARVDPSNLSGDFQDLLAETIIATNALMRVQIHKAMQFRNEPEGNLLKEGSNLVLTRTIGNITNESETTFEYCLKPPEELAAMEDLDLDNLISLPFQTQLTYKTLKGIKCVKVISMEKKVTGEKEEAKSHVQKEIIMMNAIHTSANYAMGGNYVAAQANVAHWGNYLPECKTAYRDHTTPLTTALHAQKAAFQPPPLQAMSQPLRSAPQSRPFQSIPPPQYIQNVLNAPPPPPNFGPPSLPKMQMIPQIGGGMAIAPGLGMTAVPEDEFEGLVPDEEYNQQPLPILPPPPPVQQLDMLTTAVNKSRKVTRKLKQ